MDKMFSLTVFLTAIHGGTATFDSVAITMSKTQCYLQHKPTTTTLHLEPLKLLEIIQELERSNNVEKLFNKSLDGQFARASLEVYKQALSNTPMELKELKTNQLQIIESLSKLAYASKSTYTGPDLLTPIPKFSHDKANDESFTFIFQRAKRENMDEQILEILSTLPENTKEKLMNEYKDNLYQQIQTLTKLPINAIKTGINNNTTANDFIQYLKSFQINNYKEAFHLTQYHKQNLLFAASTEINSAIENERKKRAFAPVLAKLILNLLAKNAKPIAKQIARKALKIQHIPTLADVATKAIDLFSPIHSLEALEDRYASQNKQYIRNKIDQTESLQLRTVIANIFAHKNKIGKIRQAQRIQADVVSAIINKKIPGHLFSQLNTPPQSFKSEIAFLGNKYEIKYNYYQYSKKLKTVDIKSIPFLQNNLYWQYILPKAVAIYNDFFIQNPTEQCGQNCACDRQNIFSQNHPCLMEIANFKKQQHYNETACRNYRKQITKPHQRAIKLNDHTISVFTAKNDTIKIKCENFRTITNKIIRGLNKISLPPNC